MRTTRLTIENKDLYRRYQGLKKRCYNKKCNSFKYYGKRGIKIAEIWMGKDGFYNFLIWALENGYKKELQIDRIDNNCDYSPDNCRWVDRKNNINNRRNSIKINGKTLGELANEMCYSYDNLWSRYHKYGDVQIKNRICLECQKEFSPYRNNQKFCSKRCGDKYRKISNKIPCLQNIKRI